MATGCGDGGGVYFYVALSFLLIRDGASYLQNIPSPSTQVLLPGG